MPSWTKWLGAGCAVSVIGCGGALPHPPYARQATSALTQVDYAPPPGRVETIPKRPPGADAWIDGEWVQRHGRWYWLLGRWVKTPPGAKYAPWVVARAADGTPYWAPGVWLDAHGAPMSPPRALAFAAAFGGAVVDAEGNAIDTGRAIKTVPPRPATDQARR